MYKKGFYVVLVLFLLETFIFFAVTDVYRIYRHNSEDSDIKLREGLEINKEIIAKNESALEINKKLFEQNNELWTANDILKNKNAEIVQANTNLAETIKKYCPAGLISQTK